LSDSKEKFINDNMKHNFIFNTIDGALYSLGMIFIAFNTIFPVFLRKLGGTNLLISLIPFITIAGSSIPQLFAAHYIKGLKRKKSYVLFWGAMQRIPWGIIGIGCLLLGNNSPKSLIALALLMYATFSIASGFVGPAWFDFFSKVTPISIRGRSLSIRAIIGQLFGIVGAILAGSVISVVAFPNNYAILFFITFTLVTISIISLGFVREPADDSATRDNDFLSFLKTVPEVLKGNRDFKYFIFSRAFYELSMSAAAFYAVYGIKHFGLADSYAGIFTTISSVTYVLINFLLGYLGDKKGHKLNLLVGIISLIVASILAITINNIFFYCIIFILTAVAQSAKDISISSITVEFCKSKDRATYLALSSIIMIPVSLIVLAMGSIADSFGYSYLFGLTIAASLIACLILQYRVKDPRQLKRVKM
jgi:MFS family permease